MAIEIRADGIVFGDASVQLEPFHNQVSLRYGKRPCCILPLPVPPNRTVWLWVESYAMAWPDRTGGLVSGDACVQFAGVWATAGTDNNASTTPPVHFAIFKGLSPSINVTLSEMFATLQAADAHGSNIIHPHCFLHHKRLAVFHANQIAIKPRDGAQSFPDLLLLRKNI